MEAQAKRLAAMRMTDPNARVAELGRLREVYGLEAMAVQQTSRNLVRYRDADAREQNPMHRD